MQESCGGLSEERMYRHRRRGALSSQFPSILPIKGSNESTDSLTLAFAPFTSALAGREHVNTEGVVHDKEFGTRFLGSLVHDVILAA